MTIDSDKFCFAAVIEVFKLFYFLFPSNDIFHKKSFYSSAKIQKCLVPDK